MTWVHCTRTPTIVLLDGSFGTLKTVKVHESVSDMSPRVLINDKFAAGNGAKLGKESLKRLLIDGLRNEVDHKVVCLVRVRFRDV